MGVINTLTTDNKIEIRNNNFYSQFRSKAVNEAQVIFDKWPEFTSIPKELRMDFSRVLEKPFFIKNLTWSDSMAVGANVGAILLPSDIIVNELLHKPFQTAVYFRMKICLMIQVSGTPMHSGCLIAAAMPPLFPAAQLNQLLPAPHAFLFANESTPICVEVPFYSPTVVRYTSPYSVPPDAFDYARVTIQVINSLGVPTGGSTSVTVSVQAVVKDCEFYVPAVNPVEYIPIVAESGFMKIPTKIFDGLAYGAKSVLGDVIDSTRQVVRAYTGFHNPNSPAINSRVIATHRNFPNNVDQPTLYEKLDQHAQFDRIAYDYLFDSSQDDMDLKFILSKPAYLGTFRVNTTDPTGTRLFATPITPCIEDDRVPTGLYRNFFCSPMRLLFESSLYWRGSLKMHIQSSMNNFQYCKLLVARNYEIPRSALYDYIAMSDVTGLMTETLEFSAGGQLQTIDLPFCSLNEQICCYKDSTMNALVHGLVSIYLLQPLVVNGSSPTSCEFNVYFSAGEDFQFYGYSNDNVGRSLFGLTAESAVTVEPSQQNEVLNDPEERDYTKLRNLDFKPMTNIRDYIRRMVLVGQVKYNNAGSYNETDVYDIADLLRGNLGGFSAVQRPTSMALRTMYYGCTGGFKIKVKAIGAQDMVVKYYPPQHYTKTGPLADNYWYKTQPNGLGISEVNYRSRESSTGTNFADVLPNATPFQEIPVVSRYAGGKTLSDNRNILESEFVIPNMSVFRFVSSEAIYSSTGRPLASSSYGSFSVSFVRKSTYPDPDDTVYLNIYLGATDETRLGQHFGFVGAIIPISTDPSTDLDYRSQSDFNQGLGTTTYEGFPLLSVKSYKGSYFIKTT